MLKQKFERTRGNRPRVQQCCSTYQDIQHLYHNLFINSETASVLHLTPFTEDVSLSQI